MASVFGTKRPRSVVWRYFDKGTETGTSHCILCGDNVKHQSNTSNLFKVSTCTI